MLQDNGLLTEEQVAGLLMLSVATLANWRAQKRGPNRTKIGRRCLYGLLAGRFDQEGFSAHQLHRALGCQYNTAWFMHHRIMEAMC
jgi:hypothetical protein